MTTSRTSGRRGARSLPGRPRWACPRGDSRAALVALLVGIAAIMGTLAVRALRPPAGGDPGGHASEAGTRQAADAATMPEVATRTPTADDAVAAGVPVAVPVARVVTGRDAVATRPDEVSTAPPRARPTAPRRVTPANAPASTPGALDAPREVRRKVRINARPWALFTVDDGPTQYETIHTLELVPGAHRIHFTNPPMRVARDVTIVVPADRDLDHVEDLRR